MRLVGYIITFACNATNNSIMIRQLNENEYGQVSKIALEVYTQCGTNDFDTKGLELFKDFIYDSDSMRHLTIYGAFDHGILIGILATKDRGEHISLFFIRKEYHRKGIGKKLFEFAYIHKPVKEITVNSSSYAVRFYQSLGFKKVGEQQQTDGLTYTPMAYVCN